MESLFLLKVLIVNKNETDAHNLCALAFAQAARFVKNGDFLAFIKNIKLDFENSII